MKEVLSLCAEYPLCIEYILDFFQRIKDGEKKTQDLISGFMLDEPENDIDEEEFVQDEDLAESEDEDEEANESCTWKNNLTKT